MSNKIIVLGLAIFSFFTQAGAQEVTIRTWYVADAKIGCQVGDAITSCLRIKDSLSGEWRNFEFEIEGFEHEKGFEYHIEVTQEKLRFTEQNGPAFKWSLNRIISKKNTVHTDKRLLANNTFNLLSIELYGKKKLALKAKPFIKFGIDTNLISGFSGCNSFHGPCSYATAFIEFGQISSTRKACPFQEIENNVLKSLTGKATFYVRNNILYVVCENFMTLHLKPERSLDSILKVIEEEKLPKHDVNFMKNDDGTYRISAPTMTLGVNLFFMYRSATLSSEERKKIKYKFVPVNVNPEISQILILNKEHEKPDMYYALITYKNGKKKEVEIRDDN